MDDLSALALALYPSLEHDELAVGPYVHQAGQAASPEELAAGVDVRWRHVGVRVDDDDGDEHAWAKESALRIARGNDGVIRLDRLDVAFVPLMGFRARPELGEGFDWTIGSGRRELGWSHGNGARAQWRVYSPLNLAPIGFSNTDQDDDAKLKYQVSALGGLGADVLARVVGPVGVQLRVEGTGRTARRFANDTGDNVRHELDGVAELGLTWIAERQAWTVGAWAEHLAQWNPRDDGPDGVDRRYAAGGLRLAARLYPERDAPDIVPADLERLLENIDRARSAEPKPEPEPEPEPPVEPEPGDDAPAPVTEDAEPPAPETPPAEPRSEDAPISRPPVGPTP